MDPSVLKKNIKKLVGQRNIFLFFSLVLVLSVSLLTVLLLSKKERIVIVPTSGADFWIEEGRASDGYVEKMGMYLSDFLLNRTPVDIQKRNKIILEHVYPASYHEFKKLLQQEEENVIKKNQIFLFTIEKIGLNDGAFFIEGESIVMLGKQGDSPSIVQKSKKRYTLRFICERGRLFLKSMKKEDL